MTETTATVESAPGSRFPADRLVRSGYPGRGLDLPVVYGDLDTNGHLNNVMVQRYFEHVRSTAHRSVRLAGLLRAHGGRILVVHSGTDYLRESTVGQTLHVRVRLGRVGRSSFVEEHAAWLGDDCVALADVTFAYREADRAAALPPDVRAALTTMCAVY